MNSIDRLMETVAWRPLLLPNEASDSDIPFATHEGEIQLGEHKVRCYKLSDGQRIFNGEDFDKLWG